MARYATDRSCRELAEGLRISRTAVRKWHAAPNPRRGRLRGLVVVVSSDRDDFSRRSWQSVAI